METAVLLARDHGKIMRVKLRSELLERGWVDKGDVLVRYSNPRIGWKPADGTLIVGYHEHKDKVSNLSHLSQIIGEV